MEIKVTERAAKEIKVIIADKKAQMPQLDFFLRAKVVGGGCCGFSYGLEIDTNLDDHDRIFEDPTWGFKVAIDNKSLLYLNGAEIDYEILGLQAGFKIMNPNAKQTCGCGQSFG